MDTSAHNKLSFWRKISYKVVLIVHRETKLYLPLLFLILECKNPELHAHVLAFVGFPVWKTLHKTLQGYFVGCRCLCFFSPTSNFFWLWKWYFIMFVINFTCTPDVLPHLHGFIQLSCFQGARAGFNATLWNWIVWCLINTFLLPFSFSLALYVFVLWQKCHKKPFWCVCDCRNCSWFCPQNLSEQLVVRLITGELLIPLIGNKNVPY